MAKLNDLSSEGKNDKKDVQSSVKTGSENRFLGLHKRLFGHREIPLSSLEKEDRTRLDDFKRSSARALEVFNEYDQFGFCEPDSNNYTDYKYARNLMKVVRGGQAYCEELDQEGCVNVEGFRQKIEYYQSHVKAFFEQDSNIFRSLRSKAKQMEETYTWDQKGVKKKSQNKLRLKELHPEDRLLFDKGPIKRQIAEERAVTRKYQKLFEPERVQKPGIYNLAVEIVENKNRPDEQLDENYLLHLKSVNKQLYDFATNLAVGDVANRSEGSEDPRAVSENSENIESEAQRFVKINKNEEDLNPFQVALRDAVVRVRSCNDWFMETWAGKYSKWFEFDSSWLRGSLEKLGIKVEDVRDSYQELFANTDACDAIAESDVTANDVAYVYAPKDVVPTLDKLTRANARLDYIRRQLLEGFPVEPSEPINGLREKSVSARSYNCLIHSWLELSTNWDQAKIEEEAKVIRGVLIQRMEDRLKKLNQADAAKEASADDQSPLDAYERELLSGRIIELKLPGTMLDQGSIEGKILIDYLAERKLIDPERGLLIFRLDNKRMRCSESEIMPRMAEATSPYYVFSLQQDYHFNAMVEAENLSGKPETVKSVVHRMQEMSSISERYKEEKAYKAALRGALKESNIERGDYLEALVGIPALVEWGNSSSLQNELEQDFLIKECKKRIEMFERVDAAMLLSLRARTREEVLLPRSHNQGSTKNSGLSLW